MTLVCLSLYFNIPPCCTRGRGFGAGSLLKCGVRHMVCSAHNNAGKRNEHRMNPYVLGNNASLDSRLCIFKTNKKKTNKKGMQKTFRQGLTFSPNRAAGVVCAGIH